jgi:gp16 family phage-associated protein
MNRPFTNEQIATARANLFTNGVTVQDFCQKHGLSYNAVMAVLHGRSRATRGEGHQAAVLLGLKKAPPTKHRKAPPVSQPTA